MPRNETNSEQDMQHSLNLCNEADALYDMYSLRILPGLFLIEIRIFSLLAATEFQRDENSGKSTIDL